MCRVIPRVENRTRVAVLQHPRERTHPFGTARLAELGLSQVEVIVDYVGRVRKNPDLLGSLAGTALLYPSRDARDVTSLEPSEYPSRLLVIDGTWHHAKTLYRDVPILRTLPHLTLPSDARSAYQIRRQPRAHCLSTIEAIVLALRSFERDTPGLDGLLGAFMTMQTEQLALVRSAGRQRKPARARSSRAIPRAMIEDYADLVVVYVDSVLDPGQPEQRALLCCAAERVSTGERFFRLIHQPNASDAHLEHLGLEREQLAAGISLAAFRREWSAFVGPRAHWAAWNHSTLRLLSQLSEHEPQSLVALKGSYLNLRRFSGALEEIVRREELTPRPQEFDLGPARSRLRLEHALRLAEFLHRRGQSA